MKILIDTHILLWLAFDNSAKLSSLAIILLDDLQNEIYVSLASLWEVSIKSSLVKADFNVNVEELEQGLLSVGCHLLPIDLSHIVKSSSYPLIHRDPFDRLLLAQAEVEKYHFLTADNTILNYQKPFILNAKK